MRCRLLPTADVPSHTSGAAMCHKRSVVGFINGGSDGNGRSFYLFETGEQIERGSYFFIVS